MCECVCVCQLISACYRFVSEYCYSFLVGVSLSESHTIMVDQINLKRQSL